MKRPLALGIALALTVALAARADIAGVGWGVIGSNVTTMRYSGEISY